MSFPDSDKPFHCEFDGKLSAPPPAADPRLRARNLNAHGGRAVQAAQPCGARILGPEPPFGQFHPLRFDGIKSNKHTNIYYFVARRRGR